MLADPRRERKPRAALVVLAAGEGRRSGHETNKVLLPLAGLPVFMWSLRRADRLPDVVWTVLVIREADREAVLASVEREVEDARGLDVVTGGDSRHASEWSALQALAALIHDRDVDVVVIHDAARPLAGTPLFEAVIAAAAIHGAAIPVVDQAGLAGRQADDPPPPERVVAVQTPQAFHAKPLLAAYERAQVDGFVGTDTASCIERYTDVRVHCVPGDSRNVKITFPEDLLLAERLLAKAGCDLTGVPEGPVVRR